MTSASESRVRVRVYVPMPVDEAQVYDSIQEALDALVAAEEAQPENIYRLEVIDNDD